ncbi:hypothetical protein [Caulobacter sp. LARHSG274]
MPNRFDLREDVDGWTVFDRFTGWPAVVAGVAQTGLDIQDADELAEWLDRLSASGHPIELVDALRGLGPR